MKKMIGMLVLGMVMFLNVDISTAQEFDCIMKEGQIVATTPQLLEKTVILLKAGNAEAVKKLVSAGVVSISNGTEKVWAEQEGKYARIRMHGFTVKLYTFAVSVLCRE